MDKIVKNSEFLQSAQWRKFQEEVGRKTFHLENEGFSASVIEHNLPVVGKYFYVPRGPEVNDSHQSSVISHQMQQLTELAKKNDAGWIRIEPETAETLKLISENISEKVVRAPHDMQPKEVFVLDISKTPEQLLSEMKPKTRYNINLAKKKGVMIVKSQKSKAESQKYVDAFLKLTREMATRNGIATHSEDYYHKMMESFPQDSLKIYVAEYDGKIIAANLVLFFGSTATYLHGASGNENRNVMAPFFLQWQAILDARENGCTFYDFGGVQTAGVDHQMHSDLVGVTNFKLGFAPETKPIEFPGSYDIIVNPRAYAIYRGLQKAKAMFGRIRK